MLWITSTFNEEAEFYYGKDVDIKMESADITQGHGEPL